MIIFFCLLFSFGVSAKSIGRTFSHSLNKSGQEIIFSVSSFATSSINTNLNTDRTFKSGESFTERDMDLTYRYGLADQLELGIGGKFRMVEANSEIGVGNDLTNFTASGLHSVFADLKYTFKSTSNWETAVIFKFGSTLFKNPEGTSVNNEIALGDEGLLYDLGGALTYSLTDENYISSKLLYRVPGRDISKEIFYQMELGLLWPKFLLAGGVEGVKSLETDAYTGDEVNKPDIGVGPSNRYNSINRNIVEAYGTARFNLASKIDMGLKFKTTLALNRSDLGQTIMVDLRYFDNEQTEQNPNKEFKNYRVEGEIVKVSNANKYILIDKGLSDDVVKRMRFHIFINDYTGGSRLVALAAAVKVRSSKSILKILKRYSKRKIQAGFIVRGGQIR